MIKESQTSSNNYNKINGTVKNYILDLRHFVNLDSENKTCFDCSGAFPTHVSINNGVFICSNCANNHQKLGFNISFIHPISSPWDPYLLSYAERGGNTRFMRLCQQFDVPFKSTNENAEERLNKYIIKVGEYNRLLLRSEILADEPPPPLYYEGAKKPIDFNIIYFPEFRNYQLYKGEIIVPSKTSNSTNSVGGKILTGTKYTVGALGTAGKVAYKVGKPVVCFLGKTTYSGLKYLGSSVWNHYINSDKNENTKNNSKTNNTTNNNYNNQGKNIMNDFTLVDYSDEDLHTIKTVDLNDMNKGSINVNYNNNINTNINNNNYNYNYNQNMNIGFQNYQSGNISISKHNNIIANDNYLMNNGNEFMNINNINNSNENILNNINIDNNTFSGFEIVSQEKEQNNIPNSIFENNSFAGMDVQFENTDKEKARKDANNFLLMP